MMIDARRLLPLALLIGAAAPLHAQTSTVRAEAVKIASDPGVTLPGELQLPPGRKRPPVVLLLGGEGRRRMASIRCWRNGCWRAASRR